MKRQIRRGVFETNSSSTHSLTICSEEEFERWKKGELLFNCWKDEFVEAKQLTEKVKIEAKEEYNCLKQDFWKDWNTLSDEEKDKWYSKYAYDHELKDEDAKTYEEYMEYSDLETFEERYTSKSGDKIVAFGVYGTDY